MPAPSAIDGTIDALGARLRPVVPLRPPLVRASMWISAVVLAGVVLACLSDDRAMLRRLDAAPDLWLAVFGSAATGVLGAVAALHLSVPGRSPWWVALPLPALALWIGASGLGCLRAWAVPGTHDASLAESRTCLVFIVAVSAPLSALLLVLVRRGLPLRPNLTALAAGLGVAGAAATLLNFFHPYDASASDLAVHALAVALVVAANQGLVLALPRPVRGGRHRTQVG